MRVLLALAAALICSGCDQKKAFYGPGDPEYDRIQDQLATIQAYEGRNDWQIDVETSPVTDAKQVTLRKYSAWTDNDELKGEDRTSGPSLIIRCMDGKTDVILDPDAYLAESSTVVGVRYDAGTVIETPRTSSSSKDATGWWGNSEAVPMARRLAKSTTVAFRVHPYAKAPQDMLFNMADLSRKLPEVAAACGWTIEPTAEEVAAQEAGVARAMKNAERILKETEYLENGHN